MDATEHRFWSKVDKSGPGGCWLWTANRVGRYGRFSISRDESHLAHRYAYKKVVGAIPAGLQLDHLCRVPHCVNPAHLEPVTARENLMRGDTHAARNARKTHCPAGHHLSGDNLYVNPHRQRTCRTCQRAADQRSYRKNRDARRVRP